jgi:hypothetical protein
VRLSDGEVVFIGWLLSSKRDRIEFRGISVSANRRGNANKAQWLAQDWHRRVGDLVYWVCVE